MPKLSCRCKHWLFLLLLESKIFYTVLNFLVVCLLFNISFLAGLYVMTQLNIAISEE